MSPSPSQTDRNWLHGWSVVLVCATFPLVWVGGLVTTTDAGMAFPDWLTSDGTFMLIYPWFSAVGDKFVEHGHRLLGALVGFLSIVLVVVAWRTETRSWVRKLSLAILASVIAQGVLGGLRIRLDERVVAKIHGCTAPIVFSLTVLMATATSKSWRANDSDRDPSEFTAPWSVAILSLICAVVAYVQLVLGAQIRHAAFDASPFLYRVLLLSHVGFASVVAMTIVAQAVHVHGVCPKCRWLVAPTRWLVGLLSLQLLLGATTWVFKYGVPEMFQPMLGEYDMVISAGSRVESFVVTGHVATGSLIVAVALLIAARGARVASRPNRETAMGGAV